MSLQKPFNMILCMGPNGGIGFQGKLAYHLKNDLKFFKNVTLDSAVIMGRKTWESIGQKPLKQRTNIIISQTMKPSLVNQESVQVFGNLSEALSFLDETKKNVFVIGGKKLYEEGAAHKNCQSVYLTRVGVQTKCDVFIDQNIFENFEFNKISKTMSEGDLNYDFVKLIRKGVQHNNQDNYIKDKHEEYQYLEMIKSVISKGVEKNDRTGVGTISTFGNTMRFDLNQSFPLLTTKKVFFRGVVEELLWFIRGETNGNTLLDKKIKIWEGNGSREYLDSIGLYDRQINDLGPVYGFQWRHFGAKYKDMHQNYKGHGVDQLSQVIHLIKTNPHSRRIIMNSWNPVDLHEMALPPCHVMSQFNVQDGALNCMMVQRSCDFGLGIPFNIASYSLLTCLLADICNLKRGEFFHVLGDTHIYQNHKSQLEEQIKRIPYPFPLLKIKNQRKNIEDYQFSDFDLIGYQNHEKLQMKMAV